MLCNQTVLWLTNDHANFDIAQLILLEPTLYSLISRLHSNCFKTSNRITNLFSLIIRLDSSCFTQSTKITNLFSVISRLA